MTRLPLRYAYQRTGQQLRGLVNHRSDSHRELCERNTNESGGFSWGFTWPVSLSVVLTTGEAPTWLSWPQVCQAGASKKVKSSVLRMCTLQQEKIVSCDAWQRKWMGSTRTGSSHQRGHDCKDHDKTWPTNVDKAAAWPAASGWKHIRRSTW